MARKPTKTADEIYDDNAEASRAKGVVRKGTRAPPAGNVKVTHKRKGLGMAILDKAQLMYLTTTGLVGEFMIYDYFSDPWQPHLMWAYGICTIVVALPAFLRKRE